MANVTKKKNVSKKTSNTINKKVKKGTRINKVEEVKTSRKLPFVEKILSRKRNIFITIFLIFVFAVLLIVSSYAWFSTTLNVKIKTFNMVVTRNDGLSISHDAVTYGNYIEISRDLLYDNLAKTYPGHRTIWNQNGLIPVSTNGNSSRNSYFFDVYTTTGIFYKDFAKRTDGHVTTKLYNQSSPKKYSYFLSFDIFFFNDTGSPVADNLYFDSGTGFVINEELDEQMQGLVNSLRIGIIKVGSLPATATPSEVQNIQCNNDCEAIIFEPFRTQHENMAIENAAKYGIRVVDGEEFPTYANVNAVVKKPIKDIISGSDNLDTENFKLQHTITEDDFAEPLFTVPDGYTKARIYVWIEGQDIDSLETMSSGTNVDLSVNFVKDTLGYDSFNDEEE
ncbi:MAG: hypothetical protein IJO27_01065 [Bacilli bacterium]|nr:hypothetical protein [Bacilli bacterium]MBQ6817002.1 hypothetical protein [Bacilli bacterium]